MTIKEKIESMSKDKAIKVAKKLKNGANKHITNAMLYHKLHKLGKAVDFYASGLLIWSKFI